jgi:ectoine hydroxylase
MRLSPEQLQQFDREGYLFFASLFSREEIRVLNDEVPALYSQRRPENVREKSGEAVRTNFAAHLYSYPFAKLARHPRMVEPIRQLFGEDVYMHQFKINGKAAFDGDVWQWHQDYGTWRADDQMPEARAMNVAIFLDDVTEFNGPLWFIRGSHRPGPAPTGLDTVTTSYALWTVPNEAVARLAGDGGILSAHGPAGTGLIFGDLMVHGSPANMSPWDRRIFSLILNPIANQQTAFKRPDYQHHRDFSPVVPLADDCLLADTRVAV